MDEPPLPDWATIGAKRKEEAKKEPAPRFMLRNIREFKANPKTYVKDLQGWMEKQHAATINGLESGTIIEVAHSDDPELVKMQETIDRMANASGQFKTPPRLIMHTSASKIGWGKEENGFVRTTLIRLPNFIETIEDRILFLKTHPKEFKVIMAHEMGHLANEDFDINGHLNDELMYPNKFKEVMADRRGAIIYGNPEEYANIYKDLIFSRVPASAHHVHSQQYLSPNGRARMLRKWADILKREGATDKDGNVIVDKAMAVYKRSEDLSESLLKMEQAIIFSR